MVSSELTAADAAGLVASIPGLAAMHTVQPDGRFVYLAVNDRAVETLGRSADSLVGLDVTEVFGPGAQVQLAAMLARAVENRGPVSFATVLPLADGPVAMDAVLTPYFDDEGNAVQLLWAAVDSTGELATREALARSEARFRSLVENAFDGVGVMDDDGRYTWVSPSLDRLMGLEPGTLVGMRGLDLVHPDDVERAASQLTATVEGESAGSTWIGRARHASGEWRMLEVQGTNLRHDPNVGGIVLNVRDITEQHRAETALRSSEREYRRLALHDSLTGLPNRSLFDDRLRQGLARLDRQGGVVAVLFCDIDGFKWLNDSLGHAVGDAVIVDIAERIMRTVRVSDTVARFGGDEFLVLCTDVGSAEEALVTAARITDAVREPLVVSDTEVQLTVSIGVTVTDRPDARPEELVAQADAAMYEAKGAGRDRVSTFDPAYQHRARARIEITAELRRAISEDRLVLHYQPLVGLSDGGVRGVEALLRWSHPERGLLYPAEFLAIAEDSGLMSVMGEWVVHEACMRATTWPDSPLRVNVNLSPRQLTDPSLTDRVQRILDETGLAPDRLQLEVTENAVMDDVVDAARSLSRLRDLGVRVGIDDFGTGHSALAYLRQLPLDFLKIDRSFVTLLGQDRRDESIVAAIVGMARALGLETVAEGVETSTQHAMLTALGCDVAQGWYLGRPSTIDQEGSPSTDVSVDDR